MTIEDYSSLFATIRDCSPLFAPFVLFAIRYSGLFAVRYSRLFAIRYSGFPLADTPREILERDARQEFAATFFLVAFFRVTHDGLSERGTTRSLPSGVHGSTTCSCYFYSMER